ncbi:LOW QUALITY PROTEIN: hypothetical protein V2J09_005654, partial [Rumex salicifolius]
IVGGLVNLIFVGLSNILSNAKWLTLLLYLRLIYLMLGLIVYVIVWVFPKASEWNRRVIVVAFGCFGVGIQLTFMLWHQINNSSMLKLSLEFGTWVHDLSLVDHGFKGNRFTWMRGLTVENRVAKRLDQLFCCTQGRVKWQEAGVTHFPFLLSDHAPLYLQLEQKRACNPYSLANNQDTLVALSELKSMMLQWNQDVYGNIHTHKVRVMSEVQKTQRLISHAITLLRNTRKRSLRSYLIKKRFFGTISHVRNGFASVTATLDTFTLRPRNRVESLKNDQGVWVTGASEAMVVTFFRDLYAPASLNDISVFLPKSGFASLTNPELDALSAPFSSDDIEQNVCAMTLFKSPGPDGFQPIVYHQCWETSGILLAMVNDTHVELISKKSRITLANSAQLVFVISYSKLLQNSDDSNEECDIKVDWPCTICSFHEEKQGKKGWMVLNLDLEKPYVIEYVGSFLGKLLVRLGFLNNGFLGL